jgi:hypothetical protein
MVETFSQPDLGDGVLRDLDASSSVLVITFGGMRMCMHGIEPFEFFELLSAAGPVKKLFLRDHHQSWYHAGVQGVEGGIDGVEAMLRSLIDEVEASKVVMLGASAGGYAALLFGRLLGVTEVHAFSPQSFISGELRERYGDNRVRHLWSAMMASGHYQSRYGDLVDVFESAPPCDTRFVLHYCQEFRIDVTHAERLASQPGVELRAYEEGGHSVVTELRERGELQPLLQSLLAD